MATVLTAVLTTLALLAFAANSLLCRAALDGGSIDPASFTAVRIGGGALALAVLLRPRAAASRERLPGSWGSAAALAAYAVGFSFAYVTLPAGVGALLLFGAVQATMLGVAARRGQGLDAVQWLGGGVALAGLVALVWPGLAAPEPLGAALMVGAGVAWGIYTLRSRGTISAARTTAGNFARAVPFALLPLALASGGLRAEPRGVALALASGAVASALGYVVWYRALRELTVARAALLQLLVPVLAAAAGVVALGEAPTMRLAVSSLLILGGVAVATRPRR